MNARVGINTDYIEGVDLVIPQNVIDYKENHHGDVFVNFLSDVNLGMLNEVSFRITNLHVFRLLENRW